MQSGPPRCRGLFRGITSLAVLYHKEPASRGLWDLLLTGSFWHRTFTCMEANYLNGGTLRYKAPMRGVWMPELVLYGIRLVAQASLWKLSTNESRGWTFLDQWEWTRLVLLRESAGPGLDPVIFAFRRTAGHPETALVVTGIVSVVSPVVSCGGVVLHPSYLALNLLFWGNFKMIM